MTRQYGNGAIASLKDGSGKVVGYRGQPTIGGKRYSFRAKTKGEVRRMIDEAKVAHAQGRLHADKTQTVSEYLWGWLETKRRSQNLRVKTLECYELNIRERLVPHIGTKKLSDLRPAEVQDTYNQLLARGLSPFSVIQAHRLLHKALADAVKLDIIARNVTEAVDPPRVPRKEMKTLTADQLETLFEATRGDRFHALWIVLGLVGLRRSEAVGLRWGDIDFEAGTLTVKRGLHRYKRGGGLQFTEPKSETSRRTVHLPKSVIRALHERKEQQAFERNAARGGWEEHDLVFATVFGKPLDPNRVNYYFRKALDKAGLPSVRVHDMRHSCATVHMKNGVNGPTVQRWLGHSSITLTLGTYSHVSADMLEDAAERMDILFDREGHVAEKAVL